MTNNKIQQSRWLILLVLIIILVANANANDAEGCTRSYSLSIPEAAVQSHSNKNKLIIAHRGASFHLPEHTLEAYRLALEIGADFIEPDLVATQDGHLIAMHTADLNVTTNVAEVFGQDREPWFSPFVNRSGYWSYNFTLEEIKTLRVHQRLPRARTTAYDGLFSIPTLVEIQQLLVEWNEQVVPQILLHVETEDDDNNDNTTTTTTTTTSSIPTPQISGPHHHYPQTTGMYAELKASPWFAEDAGINLAELLLQEMTSNPELFANILQCPPLPKYDEYIVPPLVVQSFEGEVLEDFVQQWKNNNEMTQGIPPPPMVLLSNKYKCWEESFWFEVGERWRNIIQGIGMDKVCFPKLGDEYIREESKTAYDRAEEFNLVLHPYTERPEHEFLMPGFQTNLEETQYLLCTVGVQGVFSESVHTAVMVARMGCPDNNDNHHIGADEDENSSTGSSTTTTDLVNGKYCWEDTSEATLYVGLASFVMGVFISILLSVWLNRGGFGRQRPPRQQRVPVEDADGVVLDQQDDDML